jgi:hypothetical protein
VCGGENLFQATNEVDGATARRQAHVVISDPPFYDVDELQEEVGEEEAEGAAGGGAGGGGGGRGVLQTV